MSYCSHCKAENPEDAKFCVFCGKKLSTYRDAANNRTSQRRKFWFLPTTKGRLGRWAHLKGQLIILALFALVIMLSSFLLALEDSGLAVSLGVILMFTSSVIYIAWVLALAVRRLHDFNTGTAWVIMLFIPIVNFAPIFEILFRRSDKKRNQYGHPLLSSNWRKIFKL